jgi:integrase
MTAFSLATGLRKSNVTGLCWPQVDLARRVAWIHPDQSKTRKAMVVPLNVDALRVITVQIGRDPVRVFSYKGEPVTQVTTAAWYKALKRCGIEDFRWHDLRHTWASWHVQNGTPLNVLQKLGRWESAQMVRRYAHFSADHLAVYADKLPTFTTI